MSISRLDRSGLITPKVIAGNVKIDGDSLIFTGEDSTLIPENSVTNEANSIKNTIINWTVTQTPTVQSNEISTNTITADNGVITTVETENLTVSNAVPALDVTDFSIGGESFDTIKEEIINDAKFKTPDDYPRFMKREKLPETGVYYLWNDIGNLVYTNYPFSTSTSIASLFTYTNINDFPYDCPNVTNASRTFEACEKLKEINSNDFSKLKTGNWMFRECTSLKSVTTEFPQLEQAEGMFSGTLSLTEFNVPSLDTLINAQNFFGEIVGMSATGAGSGITTWEIDLPHVTNAHKMFIHCKNLTKFSAKLTELLNFSSMFEHCESLNEFSTDSLDTVTNAEGTFAYSGIPSFEYDLPNATTMKLMFREAKNVTSVEISANACTNTYWMFYNCTPIENVKLDLPLLGTDTSNNRTNSMFHNCTNLKTVDLNAPNLYNGDSMFTNCSSLNSLTCSDFNNLSTGTSMFSGCSSLPSFGSSMNSLTNGGNMFYGCTSLASFTTPTLNTLISGRQMFYNCSSLLEFNTPIDNIQDAYQMFFGCSNLTTFNIQTMSSATNCYNMFMNCSSLTSFNANIENVTNAYQMFMNCSSLTDFNSSLKSLTNGTNMFRGCNLNKESVLRIMNSLRTENICTTNAELAIGLNNSLKTDADILAEFGLTSVGANDTYTNRQITTEQRTLEDGTVVGGATWTIRLWWKQ